MQVHVKLDGQARVLINTHHLPGVNAKALQMSKREEEVRWVYTHTPLSVLGSIYIF